MFTAMTAFCTQFMDEGDDITKLHFVYMFVRVCVRVFLYLLVFMLVCEIYNILQRLGEAVCDLYSSNIYRFCRRE